MLCCGGCSVHGRMFSSSPGFYPLDTGSILPTKRANQKCLQTSQKVLRGNPPLSIKNH